MSNLVNKNKTILVINNLYPPQELGGYGRYISDFANVLSKRGHKVQTLTSDAIYLGEIKNPEPNINRTLTLFGSYEQLPPKRIENKSELEKIIQHNNRIIHEAIQNSKPDVCLIGNIDFLGHTIFNPLLENSIPIINHIAFSRTGYPVSVMPTNPLYHVSAGSNFIKQSILNQGYSFEEISVIYPGAFVEQFRMPMFPNLEKMRITFASLVLPYKGPQTLIEALAILHSADIDFHCSIAGDTPNRNFLKQLQDFVKTHGMEEKISFLGYLPRNQLIELYGKNNILVFPSVWEEPFGISQVEAMAAGLTVITSGTGGASEIVESEVSGLTFPAGDAQALAKQLLTLPQDDRRWQRLAARGQDRARQLFDIEYSVDLLEKKFDELLLLRNDNEGFKAKKIKQLQEELKERFKLQDINFILFPNWSISEELLGLEFLEILKVIATHPDLNSITLLISTGNFPEEDANLFISSVIIQLAMKEGIELPDEIEISLFTNLEISQWEAIYPLIASHILMRHENREVLELIQTEKFLTCNLNELTSKQFFNS